MEVHQKRGVCVLGGQLFDGRMGRSDRKVSVSVCWGVVLYILL